ncbi:hypothetical protein JCM8097_006761 [Rhodosporidiobolus ruineniae]
MSDTSSAPLDAAPEASSSNPSPPPVLVASLASLPTELKARIAAHASHLRRCYDASAVRSKASKQKTSRVHDNLFALSKVDGVFHELCAPWVWETLDLTDRTDNAILESVQHILPRVGEYVKSFTFRVLADEKYEPSKAVASRERQLRTRDLLAAAALRLCPNVKTVEVFELSGVPINALCKAVAAGCVRKVERLQLYFFTLPSGSSVSAATLAAMITACPELRDVELPYSAAREPSNPHQPLYEAFAGTKNLRCLHFGGPRAVTDKLLALRFSSSLHWLSLGSWANSITLNTFRDFIAQHRSTLWHLDFGLSLEPANRSAYDPPLDLPELNSLTLSTTVEPVFLDLFVSSPIGTFKLSNTSSPFSFAQLKPFLKAHKETLVEVVVEEDIKKDIGEQEVARIEDWCYLNEVAFFVE